ncbi:MAG: hypothetical protein FWD69_17035 [Polyangiaceae bacterium]|nr:hypothetical protein [Polyangiaceae bacterium]
MRHIYGFVLVAALVAGCAEFRVTDTGVEDKSVFSLTVGSTDSPPTRITQGAMVKVPVSIERSESSTSDIQITVSGLPSGVTASPLIIPAAASTGDLEISVLAAVPQGFVDATIQGREVAGQGSASADLHLFVQGRAGSFDTTFAANGRLVDVFGRSAAAINIMVSDNDQIFVVASCVNTEAMESNTCVARLTSQGSTDTAYGASGVAVLENLSPSSAVLLSDGRVVVGGTSQYGQAAYGILNADGTPNDPTAFRPTTGTTGSQLFAMAAPDDGGVFMAFPITMPDSDPDTGTSSRIIGIAKFTNAMQLDGTFGTDGIAGVNFVGKGSSVASGIAVRPNGSVVIVGCGYDGGINGASATNQGYGIMQLLGSSGAPDPSFGTDGAHGQTWFPAADATCPTGSVALTPESRVVASVAGVIRAFTADGKAIDTTIGNDGALPVQSNLVSPQVFLDDQNRFLVTSGNAGTLESVSRFTSTGAVDNSFGSGGIVTSPRPTDFSSAYSIAASVQKSDGRIVVLSSAFPPSDASSPSVVVVSRLWN